MARFPEIKPAAFAAGQYEPDILQWWDEQGIFQRQLQLRADAPTFSFYEGPPTANGRPGVHHVLARTIKDTFCRYKAMCGYRVERKAGWDTHGLPVEIEVEKTLGLKNRAEIEAYGGELAGKPRLVGLNKIDALTPEEIEDKKRALKKAGAGKLLTLSGATGKGVRPALRALMERIAEARGYQAADERDDEEGEGDKWSPI